MRYPHERYLRYLISRRQNEYEIAAKCTELGLVVPASGDLEALTRGLGDIPRGWAPLLEHAPIEFARWLRDKGLLVFWKASPVREEALSLLKSIHLRQAIEGVLVLDPSEVKCRDELLLTFPPAALPSLPALALYRDFFWSYGDMSPRDAFEFTAKHCADRAEVYFGLTRDMASTYGVLGLRRRVEETTFHDDLIAYAHQQLQRASREGDVLEGKKQAGLASIINAAQKSLETRRELLGETDSSLVEKARTFKLARPAIPPLLCIDDIQAPQEGEPHGQGTSTG